MEILDLVKSMQSGNRDAYIEMYAKQSAPVYFLCRKLTLDDSQAAIALEGTFSAVYKNIAKLAITYSEKEGIETSLLVALMKTESNFNPNAINYNYNGSVDRGLCQLNNKTFPNLSKQDFYNPETNIKIAASFLNWCLRNSDYNLVRALAYYNAGWGNVTNENVGDLTLNYIQKITTYKKTFDDELELLQLSYQ